MGGGCIAQNINGANDSSNLITMLILTATAQKTNFLISYMQVKLVLEILEIF